MQRGSAGRVVFVYDTNIVSTAHGIAVCPPAALHPERDSVVPFGKSRQDAHNRFVARYGGKHAFLFELEIPCVACRIEFERHSIVVQRRLDQPRDCGGIFVITIGAACRHKPVAINQPQRLHFLRRLRDPVHLLALVIRRRGIQFKLPCKRTRHFHSPWFTGRFQTCCDCTFAFIYPALQLWGYLLP